jgi:hypothetical protein
VPRLKFRAESPAQGAVPSELPESETPAADWPAGAASEGHPIGDGDDPSPPSAETSIIDVPKTDDTVLPGFPSMSLQGRHPENPTGRPGESLTGDAPDPLDTTD